MNIVNLLVRNKLISHFPFPVLAVTQDSAFPLRVALLLFECVRFQAFRNINAYVQLLFSS
jgi:hypothetical protein